MSPRPARVLLFQAPFCCSLLVFGAAVGGLISAGRAGAQTILSIPQIQGADHVSPFDGATVSTSGIVTAVGGDGFYLQDPLGDGDDATSDGIFVFTDSSPAVAVGDRLSVTAGVSEFVRGSRPNDLPLTELVSPSFTVLSSGNALPAPVVIGSGGRAQPTSVFDNDGFTSFDPTTDGIDFYESLEGMRVEVRSAAAVSTTNGFGEIWAVPDGGAGATGFNARGGITISAGDFNPERVQIDDNLLPQDSPSTQMGDLLGDVVGVMNYAFGDYEINATTPLARTPGGVAPEQSSLQGAANRLTVASYNVLNLDPFDSSAKFDALGSQIANNLNAPDIVALQEIQDSDGPGGNFRLDADATYAGLIDSIRDAGGPTYFFAEVPPPTGNIDGGEPTGNIRVGYLYNPDRVSLVGGSLIRHGDGVGEFNNSRKPLEATFEFNGEEVTLINNHFRAKGGSTGLFEVIQPPINGGESTREEQAEFVADLVDQIVAADPDARVIVLGDLNDFGFSTPLAELTGQPDSVLSNLEELLDPTDRFTFVFDGNSQSLDHMLVTDSLLAGADFETVNLNAGLLGSPSDHDPLLASFVVGVPEPGTAGLGLLLAAFASARRRFF
ncbi:MAG: endonuclease/exonuclease/phosphatase family protein [Planctomycetota bacterium]